MKKFELFKEQPERYVLHISSPQCRSSILKHGLLPQAFENSQWKNSKCIYYPPAIFVNNHSHYSDWFYFDEWVHLPFKKHYFDCWRIDTMGLNNKWFVDGNSARDTDRLLTTEAIPLKHLKLFVPADISCSYCDRLICGLSLYKAIRPHDKVKEDIKLVHLDCHLYEQSKFIDMDEMAIQNKHKKVSRLPYMKKTSLPDYKIIID